MTVGPPGEIAMGAGAGVFVCVPAPVWLDPPADELWLEPPLEAALLTSVHDEAPVGACIPAGHGVGSAAPPVA
jgi:hypothetical protein